jgi:hypothetical protein
MKFVSNVNAEATKTMIEACGCQQTVLLNFERVKVLATWDIILSFSSVPFTLITVGVEINPQTVGT